MKRTAKKSRPLWGSRCSRVRQTRLFAKAPNGLLIRKEPPGISDAPGNVGWTSNIKAAKSWKSPEEALAWCAGQSPDLAKWVKTGIADPGPGYNKDAIRLVSRGYLYGRL